MPDFYFYQPCPIIYRWGTYHVFMMTTVHVKRVVRRALCNPGLNIDIIPENEWPVTYLTFSPATNPLTARMLKTFCENGQMVIGVGIDNNGVIQVNGYIRHWVIVLDVIPCGAGGFVRVYNPFQNREETYDFSTVWGSMFPGGAGSKVLLTDL